MTDRETDRQTDGRTDGQTELRSQHRASIAASRGKNGQIVRSPVTHYSRRGTTSLGPTYDCVTFCGIQRPVADPGFAKKRGDKVEHRRRKHRGAKRGGMWQGVSLPTRRAGSCLCLCQSHCGRRLTTLHWTRRPLPQSRKPFFPGIKEIPKNLTLPNRYSKQSLFWTSYRTAGLPLRARIYGGR